ncbi:MAG: HYR domain-containing protein [Verrucomicrobia bacterium]|nr:MAG: HYR domain-containing protein [Verrucomicrobiota bacterium]
MNGNTAGTNGPSLTVPTASLALGTHTIAVVVTGQCGSATNSATLTVDDSPPVAVCQDITVQLDATGHVNITPAQIDNGSNDACGIASLSLSKTNFDCTNIGTNQVTLTMTDNNGNTQTCTATVTVLDAVAPTITINDVSVTEGNSGTTTAVFTVTLSHPSCQTVTVNYATADGTATLADNDYQSASGTITFNPGQTNATITVLVNGDNKFEPDETFAVNLSDPVNAGLADSQGIGTILADDPQPTIAINDVSVVEGNSGTTNAVFTVSLSNPSYQTITLNYATGNNTATLDSDDHCAGEWRHQVRIKRELLRPAFRCGQRHLRRCSRPGHHPQR